LARHKVKTYLSIFSHKTIITTHNQNAITLDEKGSDSYHYQVQATASLCSEKVEPLKKQAGRFVLATNVLDIEALTSGKMLYTYKNKQQSVERCFAFLKDPMFLADSVFLKSPKRIEALGLIMALSLLVYKVAERQIRKTPDRFRNKKSVRSPDFSTKVEYFNVFNPYISIVRAALNKFQILMSRVYTF